MMKRNILVIYSTVSGFTEKAAGTIAGELERMGADVTTRDGYLAGDLLSFRAVIIGSPVIKGKAGREMLDFIRRNNVILSSKPVALFFTCMGISRKSSGVEPPFPVYVDPSLSGVAANREGPAVRGKRNRLLSFCGPVVSALDGIRPYGFAVFRGGIDYSRLGFFERAWIRLAGCAGSLPLEGDYINYPAVRAWAEKVYLDIESRQALS